MVISLPSVAYCDISWRHKCAPRVVPSHIHPKITPSHMLIERERNLSQTDGPALITSSVASSLYFSKLSMNSFASLVTSSSKSLVPVQLFLGLSISSGTFGQVLGTIRRKVGYSSYSTLASSPEWMASRMARVYFSGQRLPPVAAPAPTQPVSSQYVSEEIRKGFWRTYSAARHWLYAL